MKKGVLICFIGIDGAGKTTHAKNLENHLINQGKSCKYIWCGWRSFEFVLFKPVIKFMKLLYGKLNYQSYDISNNQNKEIENERGKYKNGRYISYFAMFDYILKILPFILYSLYRYDYIITDRYIYDVAVGFSTNSSENIFKKLFGFFRNQIQYFI